MNNRRWYDNHEETKQTLCLLEKLSGSEQDALSDSLVGIIKEIKDFHREELEDTEKQTSLTLGIDRVLGLYQATNSRRWYDKSGNLSFAMKAMSTLPEADFRNIMDGLSVSLSSQI